MKTIREIVGQEILDSRGNPTVSVTVVLEDGSQASAAVPSGASTGEREATELRDGDAKRYNGKGVLKAVANVDTEIAEALRGMDVSDQKSVDKRMIELDGTPNKSRLGANAILGVSMAVARAAAVASQQPLYRYLGGEEAVLLPVPCLNVINGGKHADNTIDFQEFKIAPHNAPSFAEGIRMAIETFHVLKGLLHKRGLSTGIGDEGGFAPNLKNNEEAVEVILAAIEKAGYKPGRDISICLDPATSEMWKDGRYEYFKSGTGSMSSDEMIAVWKDWTSRYPIVLLEDPLGEKDWSGWEKITAELGSRLEIVGDDFRKPFAARSQTRFSSSSTRSAPLLRLWIALLWPKRTTTAVTSRTGAAKRKTLLSPTLPLRPEPDTSRPGRDAEANESPNLTAY